MAYGSFWIGLVLGWAALFAGGSTMRSRFAQTAWLIVLAAAIAFAPDRIAAALGEMAGGYAHLFFQSRLRGLSL